MSAPLAGYSVWVTRAPHQAGAWTQALEAAGARTLCEPLLTIEPPADTQAIDARLAAAERADVVLATSRNAVDGAWQYRAGFAPAGTLLAVGRATAQAFEEAAGRAVAYPDRGFTSEGLLAHPALADIVGREVVILSGEGGRTALVDTLAERGARVSKIALYRRRWLAIDPARLREIAEQVNTLVIASGEALRHLDGLVARTGDRGLQNAIEGCLLVAPSWRVVKEVDQRLHWSQPPVIVERLGGEAIVSALARLATGDRQ